MTTPAEPKPRFSDRLASVCAHVATGALGLAAAVQLGLAAGLIPVTMAWGGGQTVLTSGLRVASLAAIAVLIGFAWVLRRRAGLGGTPGPTPTWLAAASWVVTAFMALNTLGNLASQSRLETLAFAPLTTITMACGLVISLSRPRNRP